jgi:hypothetical protein
MIRIVSSRAKIRTSSPTSHQKCGRFREAVREGRLVEARRLLPSVSERDMHAAFERAIETDDPSLARLIVHDGKYTPMNYQILHLLCQRGMFDLLTIIAGRDKNVDAMLLFLAAGEVGRDDVVGHLVDECNVDLHANNEESLQRAVVHNRFEVVHFLIGRGAVVSPEMLETSVRHGNWCIFNELVVGTNVRMMAEMNDRLSQLAKTHRRETIVMALAAQKYAAAAVAEEEEENENDESE